MLQNITRIHFAQFEFVQCKEGEHTRSPGVPSSGIPEDGLSSVAEQESTCCFGRRTKTPTAKVACQQSPLRIILAFLLGSPTPVLIDIFGDCEVR